jgi:transcriptional regulator with XRE-family HTH domain
MNHYGLTAAQFADRIGVQRSVVSHVLSERNKPSLDFMVKIKTNFPEINLDWLLLGKGNPQENGEKWSKTGDKIVFPDEQEAVKKSDPIKREGSEWAELGNKVNIEPPEPSEMKNQAEVLRDIDERSSVLSKGRKLTRVILFYADGGFESYEA